MVERRDQRGNLGFVTIDIDPAVETPANGNALQLLGQLPYAVHVAALQRIEQENQSGDESEQ